MIGQHCNKEPRSLGNEAFFVPLEAGLFEQRHPITLMFYAISHCALKPGAP